MSNQYPNQFPFYQRTFSQEHPYVTGLARMLGAAGSGQGMITGGVKAAMEGYAQDQELARQRAIQMYQMQERARMAKAAGLPVSDYTTLPTEELKTFGDMQGNYNTGQVYQEIYNGQTPQFAGRVLNPQYVMPIVQDRQKQLYEQYKYQQNAQNLPSILGVVTEGKPLPQGIGLPENLVTTTVQNRTNYLNNQARLQQNEPLVQARKSYLESGTQLNNAKTQKTQKETIYVGQQKSSRGRGRAKATYDPAEVQGLLNMVEDPNLRSYYANIYHRTGRLDPDVEKLVLQAQKSKGIKAKIDSALGKTKPLTQTTPKANPNQKRKQDLGFGDLY